MARNTKRIVRQPAMKFPKLRKQIEQRKLRSPVMKPKQSPGRGTASR